MNKGEFMLNGKDIYLSAVEESDLDKLAKWINDRDTVHHNTYYRPVSSFQQDKWFESVMNSDTTHLFAIRKNEDNKLIGTCQICEINFIDRNAELRIRIGEESERGKSYGTQASELLIDFAFSDLNLNRIYLFVFADNEPAIKSYEKLKFIKEGTLKKHAYINGKYVDVIVMGIIRG
jgi:RimJ/RimL family protein N-acetyltransferase